jgi:Flp pilus assembly pilin Flp
MFSMIEAGVTYLWARFGREDGAVTTEYGLLIVFIALAVIAGMILLAKALNGMFGDASGQLNGS